MFDLPEGWAEDNPLLPNWYAVRRADGSWSGPKALSGKPRLLMFPDPVLLRRRAAMAVYDAFGVPPELRDEY